MANLKFERGTTYSREMSAFTIDGVTTSLVGATVRFTMKSTQYDDTADDSTAAVKKDLTNGTADGTITITLAPSDTATLEPGKYYYDIKVDLHSDGTTVYETDNGTIQLLGSPTNRLS